MQGAQCRCGLGGELVQLAGQRLDLGVEVLVAPGEAAQGEHRGCGRGDQRAGLKHRSGTHGLGGGQAVELLTELCGGGDQQPFERVDGLGARLDGGLVGGAERADHLHRAIGGLGDTGRLAGLDGAAAASASRGSLLPCRRRAARSGRLTSTTRCPWVARKRASPAP
jgi:hypothetical protein